MDTLSIYVIQRETERRSSLTFLCRRFPRGLESALSPPAPPHLVPTASLRSTAAAETAEPETAGVSRGRGARASPLRPRSTESSPPAALERPVEKGRAWRASPLSRFREPGPASAIRGAAPAQDLCKVRTAGGRGLAFLPAERRAPRRQEADMAVRGGAEGR